MIVRPATSADVETLFRWRNDPLTRAMFKTSDVVPYETHCDWLARRLSRSEPHLYVAEIDGTPVATVRIDGEELSYTVAPEWRGRGIATKLLQWVRDEFGVCRAEVYRRNVPSATAATTAGHTVVWLD